MFAITVLLIADAAYSTFFFLFFLFKGFLFPFLSLNINLTKQIDKLDPKYSLDVPFQLFVNTKKEKISSGRQFSGWRCLVNVGRTSRLLQTDRKTTVSQTTTC